MGPFTLASADGSQGKILARGASIHGANGLFFDAQDRLYVASLWGNEIVIIDPDTGEVLDRLTMDDGVYCPDDVTIGPDGSIYWTAMLHGNVGRMAPNGTVTTQYVSRGTNPITVNDEGRLFVGLAFMGDGLYELDPELQDPPVMIHGPLGMPNAFDFGPDGYLYGPLMAGRPLVRIDVNTDPATIETILPSGAGSTKFDSQGRLYCKGSEGIIRVDLDTLETEIVHPAIPSTDNIAFDSQDRLFVSHHSNGTIFQVFPPEECRVVAEGGMIFPNGVCAMMFGDEERVIVGDLWTIKEFDAATGEQLQVTAGMQTGSSNPSALSIHQDGDNLLISTWMGDYIYSFDPETDQVLEVFEDESWAPMDAVRFMGEIVFTDYGDGCIKRADNTTIAEGFSMPSGLAVVGDDLYAADWVTGEVWKIYDEGNLVKTRIATGLSEPEGLTDDIDGNLLVVESGTGELSRIDVLTGEVSLVADGLSTGYPAAPGMPAYWMFSGVDVGPSGNIYVTGDVENILYKFPATDRVISTVDELPDGAFRNPGNAEMYRRKIGKVLGTVQRLIDKGRYGSARAFLRFLRRRADGTGKDWVVHTAYQQALLDLIDTQIASLPTG